MRPTREAYVRTSIMVDDVEVVAGLEFIEVGRDPYDRWVQVFQPFGLPRRA